MLGSLKITGFRAFSDLTIERLGRVTLVVGKNNVGKTTLLEAMHLHASGTAALIAAHRMLERRDEYLANDQERDVDLERLFFRKNGSTASSLSISAANGQDALRVTTTWSWFEQAGDETVRRMGTPPDDADAHRRLRAQRHGHDDFTLPLEEPRRALLAPRARLRAEENRRTTILLPSSGFQGDGIEAADLWDRIVLTDREGQVIDALRIIEPSLERIVMVNVRRGRRSGVAKIRDHSPIPLRSLGDGMNRLFELALGLVSVGAGGTLLVDEIDSGLHFTTLIDVWQLIFETAARLDVQVVATTHSWDCIDAFQRAAGSHPSEGVLVRLQRAEDTIASESFTEDELAIITRESIEVR